MTLDRDLRSHDQESKTGNDLALKARIEAQLQTHREANRIPDQRTSEIDGTVLLIAERDDRAALLEAGLAATDVVQRMSVMVSAGLASASFVADDALRGGGERLRGVPGWPVMVRFPACAMWNRESSVAGFPE